MQQHCNDADSISVALALYNGNRFLSEQLSSLKDQTKKPCELIVVDDCSSDNSVEIANTFSCAFNKRIYLNDKNGGPVYTFKKLAGLCNGNHIAFCDQDDIWLPQKLELSLAEIKKLNNKVPAIVYTDMSVIDEQGKLLQQSYFQQRKIRPHKLFFADILYGNIVTGCTALINKAMAAELEKMPLNIMMHDWWMALIAFSFGENFFIDQSTVLYRSHENSVTTKHKTSYFTVFRDDYKKGEFYLKEHIQQAIEFKNMYASCLSKKDLQSLERFIALKNKPFFYKRLTRDRRSLIRRLT